jgi:hypothetical protein
LIEEELFVRIRTEYTDLLRALYKHVRNDSEASSSESDPEEDRAEVDRRRENREMRRAATKRRVKKLRRDKLPDEYRDMDVVVEWLEARGCQINVSGV